MTSTKTSTGHLTTFLDWIRFHFQPTSCAFVAGLVVALIYENFASRYVLPPNVARSDQEDTIVHRPTDRDDLYDVTIITGYYDIGTFRKKQHWRRRTTALYQKWMEQWRFVDNNVIAFFDDAESADVFRSVRAGKPTQIHLVDRYSQNSFKHLPRVTELLSKPETVQLHPETTYPAYSCVNNLKYDLVKLALNRTIYNSSYYGWLDIGTFNYHVDRVHRTFTISLPDEADTNKIIYTQVDPFENITVTSAFRERRRWLGGGAFIGRRQNLLEWAEMYGQAVEDYLDQGLVCNDQAMLYALTLPKQQGGFDLHDKVHAIPMIKWHDRSYELVYLYETTWRYPLKMCSEQIEETIKKSCLGLD